MRSHAVELNGVVPGGPAALAASPQPAEEGLSGLAGGWFAGADEGAPLPAVLASLASRLPPWVAAGGIRWCPPWGLRSSTGPVRRADLLLAFDGRLDNRSELAALLGEPGLATAPATAVVARAWERWGLDGLARLLGDWALALVEPGRGRLVLARDGLGPRPLFYHHRPGSHLLFASRLAALLDAARLPRELDEDWLAGQLGACNRPAETPWRAIRAVPPGAALIFDGERVRWRQLWSPLPGESLAHLGDAELEARYAWLFRQAVARRLVGPGPVGVELSGGLDSTSIVCVADELLRTGAAPASEILAFTYAYERSKTADERRWVRCTEARLGLQATAIVDEQFPCFGGLDESPAELPRSGDCTRLREREVARRLAAAGGRRLLRGIGGDELLWSESGRPPELADLLRKGHAAGWLRALRASAGHGPAPYPSLIFKASLYPALPAALRRRWGADAGRPAAWLDRGFVRRTDLAGRQFWESALPAGAPSLPSLRLRIAEVLDAVRVVAASYDTGPHGIVYAYPFLDRELVELVLALPLSQLVRGTETRSIHRRAIGPLLPPEILRRQLKTSMHEALVRGVRSFYPTLERLLTGSRLAALGVIDEGRARQALARARLGFDATAGRLCPVLALEAWLRAQEAPGAGAAP